jgi:hypothetical protein
VSKYKFFASEHEAKDGLVKWGATIRQKFVTDNLPLTAKQEHGGFAQVPIFSICAPLHAPNFPISLRKYIPIHMNPSVLSLLTL